MTTQELKQRTFEFGTRVVPAVEALPKRETARIPGRQLLRAGTWVGANYRAAACARSRADFIAKLGIVDEERDESAYWMEMIAGLKFLKRAGSRICSAKRTSCSRLLWHPSTARRSRRA